MTWPLFSSQGTFVLQDNRFRWLVHMSIDPSVQASGNIQDPSAMAENKSAQATGMHLYFPCGIIRGALSNLGIACAVSADISNLPACELLTLITFTLNIWELEAIYREKKLVIIWILVDKSWTMHFFTFTRQ